MAKGDIVSVTVNADGWSADVEVEDFSTGATYDFGTPVSGTANVTFTVVSQGYNSAGTLGTTTRTVYGTAAVRQTTPNQANLDESINGSSNLVFRMALSEYIYDDDDTGAGASGTAPTVTFVAGVITDAGGTPSTTESNATTDLTVTNNSTVDYPKAFGQWAMVPFQRFKTDPTLKFTANHRFGIARVEFTLEDESTNTATGNATSPTANQRTVSALYAEEYQASISLTGLDQDEELTANCVVYPTVGDADSVFDTNDQTVNADNTVLGQCDYTFYNDKSDSLDNYAVVDGLNGDDGTGVTSTTLATAEADPYLTIGAALTAGGNVIYVTDDDTSIDILGTAVTAPTDLSYMREVLPHPDNGSAVTLTYGAAKAYNTPHLKFSDFTIQKTAANAWMDGASGARYIWFHDCTTDANSTAAPVVSSFSYRSATCFLTDCTIDDANLFGMGKNFAARICHWMDGNDISSATSVPIKGPMRFVANTTDKVGIGTKDLGSTTGPLEDPLVFQFSEIYDYDGATVPAQFFKTSNCSIGISMIGNIIERSSGTNPNLQISADETTTTTQNVLLYHNTVAGERINFLYNDTGSTQTDHINASVKYNSFEEYNIKTDIFPTANANRVGNWPSLYGVGYIANGAENTLGFCNAYEGLDSSDIFGTSEAESGTSPCDPDYTDDNSVTGDGTGNGDYTPGASSDLLDQVPSGLAVLITDLKGNTRLDNGSGSIGAIEAGVDFVTGSLSLLGVGK